MLQLEIGGARVTIAAGETIIGSAPGCGVPLRGQGVRAQHLVVIGAPDGSAVVRLAELAGMARVNGVRLGEEPTPLLHGDKIEVGDQELLVVDSRLSGQTQTMNAVRLADTPNPPRAAGSQPVGLTAGRLVSLNDGREYPIGSDPLTLGRDAGCDVVITEGDASRTHAEIVGTPTGYRLTDRSANGTWVNGERMEGPRRLRRGDVIRIGGEEFRFSAEGAAPEPAEPPVGARARLSDTMHGFRVTDLVPPPTPQLASFLVRSGALKGQRLPVHAPVVNLGRADYNDLVLADPSVSAAHAKLQRREGIWVITDLGSTNGTWVDDQPVVGEAPLGPGSAVRFGDVLTMFEPVDDRPVAPLRTAVRSGIQAPEAQPRPEPAPEPEAELAARPAARRPIRAPRVTAPVESNRPTLLIAAAVVVVVAIVAYLLLS